MGISSAALDNGRRHIRLRTTVSSYNAWADQFNAKHDSQIARRSRRETPFERRVLEKASGIKAALRISRMGFSTSTACAPAFRTFQEERAQAEIA
jgi:hypothetical protein